MCRIVVVILALFLAGTSSAETPKERVEALWTDFVRETDATNFSRDDVLMLTAKLQQVDFSADPALGEATFKKMYERLSRLLTTLGKNEFTTLDGRLRPLAMRALLESLVLLAPYCGADLVEPLIAAAVTPANHKLSVAALTALISLSELNDVFLKSITEAQRKSVLAQAEKLRAYFAETAKKAKTVQNAAYASKMLFKIEKALLFFGADWPGSEGRSAAESQLEAAFILALTSAEWRFVRIAFDGISQLGALSDAALLALQELTKRKGIPQDLKVKVYELLRRNVHRRFIEIVSSIPTEEPWAQTLIDDCVGFLLEFGEAEEKP